MPHFLTKEGLKDLQDELKKIVDVDLPATLVSLNTAREDGDLKENAAYQTALKVKDDLTTRQQEIEEILKDYEIIEDVSSKSGSKTIQIGSTVVIKYQDEDQEITVKIVGSSESDVLTGKISNESPLANAIMGREKGDVCSFKSPSGKLTVKIIDVK